MIICSIHFLSVMKYEAFLFLVDTWFSHLLFFLFLYKNIKYRCASNIWLISLSVCRLGYKELLFLFVKIFRDFISIFIYFILWILNVFTSMIFKNEVFLHLGSVRPYVRTRQLGSVVNFGMLELTYWLQTFRDYSYSS